MRAAHFRIVTSRSTSVRASIYSYCSLLTVNSRLYRASTYALHNLSKALYENYNENIWPDLQGSSESDSLKLGSKINSKIFKLNQKEKRIKKLQTGNGEEIFLADYYETDYPFFVERMMHQRYYAEKKLNEWFNLTPEEKSRFREDCREFEHMAEELEDNVFLKNKIN